MNGNTPETLLELRGWKPNAQTMTFIYFARELSGVDLRTAKDLHDRLIKQGKVTFRNIDATGIQLAQRYLLHNLVDEVVIFAADVSQTPLPMPQPPAKLFCPSCQAQLKHHFECDSCNWLGYPSKRDFWGKAGACSRCGFSYRFDGKRCSHCGNGSVSTAEPQ